MPDWLLFSDSDRTVIVAAWSTGIAILTTVVLFLYTLGLRLATIVGDRRRHLLVSRWHGIIFQAVLGEPTARTELLPKIRRPHHTDLLEEWNRARSMVSGTAINNLIRLGRQIGLPQLARNMLSKHRLGARLLAIQTLGHLRDTHSWTAIGDLVDAPNSVLSVTAAAALIEIDADLAIRRLMPLIAERRDWQRTKVALFLRAAGSELVSEPLFRAIRSSNDDDQRYLLQFASLAEATVLDAIAEDIIRSSRDPGVIAGALSLFSGHTGLPRIDAFARHETWYVRLKAAQILGRAGQKKHLPLLELLLSDQEWWVRYRAAQSIVSLPFLGPNGIRLLYARQTDRYARDMLQQVAAEIGLT